MYSSTTNNRNLLKIMCEHMKEKKLPKSFKTDFKFDVKQLRSKEVKEGDELIWTLREHGTHLFPSPLNEGLLYHVMERFHTKEKGCVFHIKVTMKPFWNNKVYGKIKEVWGWRDLIPYIDFRKEEVKSLEEICKENVEKAVQCQIPTFLELIQPVEKGVLNFSGLHKLHQLYENEMRMLHKALKSAKEPSLYMGTFSNDGSYWRCDFSVSDMSAPIQDKCNWHTQNTSQWKYSGCILIDENGVVSSHH